MSDSMRKRVLMCDVGGDDVVYMMVLMLELCVWSFRASKVGSGEHGR